MNIFEQRKYKTSDGHELKIIAIWYGALPKIEFEVKGKIHIRSRADFENAIRDKKII